MLAVGDGSNVGDDGVNGSDAIWVGVDCVGGDCVGGDGLGAGAGADATAVGGAGCALAARGASGVSGAPMITTSQARHAVATTAPALVSIRFSRRARARSYAFMAARRFSASLCTSGPGCRAARSSRRRDRSAMDCWKNCSPGWALVGVGPGLVFFAPGSAVMAHLLHWSGNGHAE